MLNASLLLALVVVLDLVIPARSGAAAPTTSRSVDPRAISWLLLTGVLVSLVVVGVMMSPWAYRDGVVIDTRSVLLLTVGIFFGAVPVALAALAASVYRVILGGDGTVVGVIVIALSASTGLVLRRRWRDRLEALRWTQLAVVGFALHAVIIGLFAVSPIPDSATFARDVAPAMLTIHPVAVVAIGLLLSHRLRRHSMLRELAESEARYRQVFDNEFVAALIIDPLDGRILDVSRHATELYGWSREQMLQMTTSDLEVLPRDEVLRQIDEGRADHRSAFEFEHRTATGEVRDVEVIGGPVMIDGQMRIHTVINDITERRQTERELAAANERLHHAEKMEAIGRLAGGIAHDFNNMLQVIEGYASLAALEVVPGSDLAEHLDEIRSAAERSSELTHQLLAFARREPVSNKIVDPAVVVTEAVRWLQRLVGDEVDIVVSLRSSWTIRADPGQITQVLANLVLNAGAALEGGGHIEITTADLVIESADPSGVPMQVVRISVADDGPSLSEELVATAFDPFVTTRGSSGGTGLGLSIVDSIATQHGGFVEIETDLDHGAIFHVHFPRADVTIPTRLALPVDPPSATSATILLVDDNDAILRLGERMLQHAGHVVLTATDGDEAVAIVRDEADRIDLLVTDVVMPGSSVVDVVAELHRTHPDTPVLFVSGFTDDVLSGRGIDGESIDLLPKPFSAEELVERVTQLLVRHAARG